MKQELIERLAAYYRWTPEHAALVFNQSAIGHTLAEGNSNLMYQTADYLFSLLRNEIEADDDAMDNDDFERPEVQPEGQFVRSH